MKIQPLLVGVIVLGLLGTSQVTFAASAAEDREQIQQMGAPLPGSAGDQEDTNKQRNPDKAQNADQNAQVTLGGSKSFVTGEIRRIQNEYFFVKDEESGNETRLLVNKDTNLDCSGAPAAAGSSKEGISKRQSDDQSQGSDRQKQQGQRQDETAMGSGFSIGNCAFNTGDRIRAEVDDNGRVTMLKFAAKEKDPKMARSSGESAGTGELAIPGRQDKPGQLDMTGGHGYPPKEYTVLPVPLGEFKATQRGAFVNRPVKDPQGKTLGKLHSLIMDSNTGQVEYAVVLLDDNKTLREVPWKHLKNKQGSNGGELVLNTKDYPIDPDLTGKSGQDQSPEIAQIIGDMQSSMASADLRGEEGARSADSSKQSARIEIPKDVKGEVVRGRVLKIDGQMYTIKARSGKETRLRVDEKTQMGQVNLKDEPFKEGDRVEAYVTPDGHAFSISLMRAQGSMPNDPEAGG